MGLEQYMSSLLDKMKMTLQTDLVVGQPIQVNPEVVILPVSKVTFGFGLGGGHETEKDLAGGSGGGATVEPYAFLIVAGDQVKLMMASGKNSKDWLDRLLDVETYDKLSEVIDKIQEKFQEPRPKSPESNLNDE